MSGDGRNLDQLRRDVDSGLADALNGALPGDVDVLLTEVLTRVPPLVLSGDTAATLPVIRSAEALATSAGRAPATLRLRVLLGDAAFSEGAAAGAVDWYRSAAIIAATLDDPDDNGFQLYALAQVANVFLREERWIPGAEALTDLIEAADDAQRPEYAWPSAMALGRLHLNADDLATARYFLDLAVSRFHDSAGTSATPDRGEDLARVLATFARMIFYQATDYRAAADVAQQALAISADEPDGLRIRGFALTQLGEHAPAAAVYRRWIAAEPDNATARNNLASALSASGDLTGALNALGDAVAAAPDDLRFRMNRVNLLRNLGRPDDAVDDLNAIIRIGHRLERDKELGARQRSAIETNDQTSATDQVDLALYYRSVINFERNRADLVAADVDALLHRPDPVTPGWGHAVRGRLLHHLGDLRGSLVSYRLAAATGSPSSEVLGEYSDVLMVLSRDREALDVLERLASRDHDPQRALVVLDELARRRPDDVRVRRVRGFAHFEAWHPRLARADLRAAVDGDDQGADTYRLLGLSLILYNPDDPTAGADIPGAIDALTEAAIRDPAGGTGEAVAALAWLLDRAFGNQDWLAFLAGLVAAEEEPPWLAVLDELRPALLAYARAELPRWRQEWAASVEALTEAKEAFAAAGFPVTAARMSMVIAERSPTPVRTGRSRRTSHHGGRAAVSHRSTTHRRSGPDIRLSQPVRRYRDRLRTCLFHRQPRRQQYVEDAAHHAHRSLRRLRRRGRPDRRWHLAVRRHRGRDRRRRRRQSHRAHSRDIDLHGCLDGPDPAPRRQARPGTRSAATCRKDPGGPVIRRVVGDDRNTGDHRPRRGC